MSISTTFHQSYMERAAQWKRCRDVRSGQDAVHAAGVVYLPKLGDQTDEDYEAYKLRARLFNAMAKTVTGYSGVVMRSPSIIEANDAFEDTIKNIDRSGTSIDGYVKDVLNEVLTVGRSGTLVEYSKVKEGATKADAAGARPYWALFKAEDILDWSYQDGKLIYVVLREYLSERDEFAVEWGVVERFRVLSLNEAGVYQQEVYACKNGHDTLTDTFIPTLSGSAMKEIPFSIHQTESTTLDAVSPPLLDLVNLNLSHYRTKADHAHALHFVALPTPYVTGVDPEDPNAPSSIGPQKLWLIEQDNAKVGMLEYSGAGITSIMDELKSMEEQMAMLGARMLISELSENTATASKIKSISETSDLASIVDVLDNDFNFLINVTSEWTSNGESSVSINKDFLPASLDPAMILALVKSWQDGAITYKTLTNNFQKGEILTDENEEAEMEDGLKKLTYDPAQQKVLGELWKMGALSQETMLDNFERAGMLQEGDSAEDEADRIEDEVPEINTEGFDEGGEPLTPPEEVPPAQVPPAE